jgi:excisionase family DNA binding protein
VEATRPAIQCEGAGSVNVTLREAASELGVSSQTVRRWINAGKLPAELQPSRYGPQYSIAWEHLDAARDWTRPMARRNVHEELVQGVTNLQSELEEIRRAIDEQLTHSRQFAQDVKNLVEDLQATRQELKQLRDELAQQRR